MKIKTHFSMAIAALVAIAFVSQSQAQTVPNFGVPFQQGVQVLPGTGSQIQQYSTQQLTKEDLAKVSIGALLYDSGTAIGVRSVYSNGPAQKAGIESGDMITKANGQALQGLNKFNEMIGSIAKGGKVKLTRSKNGKESEVEVELKTMAEIFEASNVPEPTVFDEAVGRAERQIQIITQQIKNTEADLADLQKRFADQTKELETLKAKAADGRKKMEAEKAAKAKADATKSE